METRKCWEEDHLVYKEAIQYLRMWVQVARPT